MNRIDIISNKVKKIVLFGGRFKPLNTNNMEFVLPNLSPIVFENKKSLNPAFNRVFGINYSLKLVCVLNSQSLFFIQNTNNKCCY